MVFLNQNFEIEFKNLLTEDEYLTILAKEFPVSSDNKNKELINQSNYYFDTKNQDLKNQHSALRVRVTDSYNEMTLKEPHEGFLLETNLHLSDNNVSEIINNQQIILSSFISSDNFPLLKNITKDSIFYLFNSFHTKRMEKQLGPHLIVLDQTVFQNGLTDYELEVESTDAKEGKQFFDSILQKYAIPTRAASPKIRRAEENK